MSIYLANSLLSGMPLGAFNEGVQFGTWNGTATPVTLTDYSLTGTTANLAQAPAATATTTATFYGS